MIQGMHRLEKDVGDKAPKIETASKLEHLLRDVSAKTIELAGKAGIKDVSALMDGKADVDEVAHTRTHTRTHTLSVSLSHTHTHTQIYTQTHVHIHIHIHITHTHTHTHRAHTPIHTQKTNKTLSLIVTHTHAHTHR